MRCSITISGGGWRESQDKTQHTAAMSYIIITSHSETVSGMLFVVDSRLVHNNFDKNARRALDAML